MPACFVASVKASSCEGLPALGAHPRGLDTKIWMTCAPISCAYASAFGSPAPTKTWAPTGEGLRGGTRTRMSVDEQPYDAALLHAAASAGVLRVHLVAATERRRDDLRPQPERLDLRHRFVLLHAGDVGNGDELRSLADLQGDGGVAARL